MTKKKTSRQKHQKDVSIADTSEEELKEIKYQGKVCPHVARALNFARVKRVLKAANISICSNCNDVVSENTEAPEVWLCLQCGNRGCGRTSDNKHAIQHFKTIHSDCHVLTLSSSSGIVWCYECDDEVHLQQSRNLRQCVEFLMKMKGAKPNLTLDVKKSSTASQQSLLESVLREQTSAKSTVSKGTDTKNTSRCKNEITPSKLFVKGLRNLGNTCFFNAVMQNLNQTYLLSNTLEKICSADYSWEVPKLTLIEDSIVEDSNAEFLKIAIPRQFPLANSLLNFFKQMNSSTANKSEIVNPSSLFAEIAKKSPQFKHFQQQDSHELLRQLLDGVRQDEVKRQKKAILRHFDIATIAPEEVDEDTKKLIKGYSCYASHTIVEKLFGGLLISTVLCEECKMSSQVFEPFMDMSLPLFEEKHQDYCDQPYLDGGQLQDIKPLRNRKIDVDADDSNEYVLTKPKRDPGKPSKYQEHKMKQLAKREKKLKHARRRKIVENNKDSPQGTEVVSKPEVAEVESDVTDVGSSDEEHVNSFEQNQLNSTETAEDHQKCNSHSEIQDEDGSLPNNDKLSKLNGDVKEDLEIHNSPSISSCKESVNSPELHNSCLQSVPNNLNEKNLKVFDAEHQEKTVLNESDHVVLFDEIVTIDIKPEVMLFEKCNGNIASTSEDRDKTEVHIETKLCSSTDVNLDQSVEALTEEIKKVSIDNVNSLELEERMQALGLQVREVRIRRDSDRQGSLLDSSQSVDDDLNLASCDTRDESAGNESDTWCHGFSEKETKEWILKSLLTLMPRSHTSPSECSVDSCLSHFTKPELLTGSNKFRCERCTERKIKKTGNKKDVAYTNASKQLLIFSPPAILTLHLKRFQQVGMSLRKVNRFVEFPLILDIASYCSSACLILPHMASVKDKILYSLYGIVEHSGKLTSGHYTAYVKVAKRTLNQNFMCHLPLAQCDLEQLLQKFSKINSEKLENSDKTSSSESYRWYYISDSHVREVNEAQVLKCQAYLLFYERIK